PILFILFIPVNSPPCLRVSVVSSPPSGQVKRGGEQSEGGGVGEAAAEVTEGAAGADGARPAEAARPTLAEGTAAEDALHDHGGEMDAQAQIGHALSHLVVVREVVDQAGKAADAF